MRARLILMLLNVCIGALPETNIAHEDSPSFLVNTIKMVGFPWLC